MKYGIYYAYWEKEWGGQFVPYVEKCRRLGFDILEVACGAFHLEEDSFFRELRQAASDNGILLTGGYGPRPEHNLASADEAAVERAFAFYADMFRKMELAGVRNMSAYIRKMCIDGYTINSQSPWTSPAIGSAASGGWAAWRIWPLTAGLRCAWRPSTALRDT